jgi:Rad3-related DNA helicase
MVTHSRTLQSTTLTKNNHTYIPMFALKYVLIPVAALAITTTSASAFTGTNPFAKLDLTDEQTAAFEEAHEIRENAREEAKQVLEAAGIDEATLQEMHDTMREARHEAFDTVKTAIENNDYAAFTAAVANTPMADTIDTEAEFAKLVEADNLRDAGDFEAAHQNRAGLRPTRFL